MASISLRTRHGRIGGWESKPHRQPRGGLVVIQEIFGVNSHIRQVTDRFGAHGFHAVAPALFDLVEPRVELGYDEAGIAKGRELAEKLDVVRKYLADSRTLNFYYNVASVAQLRGVHLP